MLALALALLVVHIRAPRMTASSSDHQSWSVDLSAFRSEFLAKDTSFSPDARREAERRLSSLEATASGLSALAVSLELARIAALADNGHTCRPQPPR